MTTKETTMPERTAYTLPEVPTALQPPRWRYWGDRQPPKNRADMFSVHVATASAADAGQTGDTTPVAGSTATLRIYGPIDSWGGWFGVSAQDVAQALDNLPADVTEVRVRINSPGGEVWEGTAILNMLRAHRARAVAVVDGLAASAASVIAAGCEETVMSPGTQMMIHDASGFAYGPEATMLKAGAFLRSTSNAIASIYAEAAGGSDTDWRTLMVEETWYTAQEAVDAGLADRVAVVPDAGDTATAGDDPVVTVVEGDPQVEARFDLSIFNHAGRSHAPAPTNPRPQSAGGPPQPEGAAVVDLNDEQITALREQVGFPADADADTIVAATIEALTERADITLAMPAASASLGAGMVAVPQAAWDEAQHNGRLGAQAAEQLRVQEREAFLDAHRDRFLPVNRDAYRAQYDANRDGTRTYLEGAPVIVPVDLIGHEVDSPDANAAQDDGWFPGIGTPAGATTITKGA